MTFSGFFNLDLINSIFNILIRKSVFTIRRLCLLTKLTALCAFQANANYNDINSPAQNVLGESESTITPTHCITTYPDQPCDLIITVTWPDELSNDLCLYQESELLTCWNSDNYAFYVTNITLNKPVPLTLKATEQKTNEQKTLVSTEIRISAVKNKRRRLRPRWSIF